MRLDIFMQELSYEEITQQKAYDVLRLLSEYSYTGPQTTQ